MKKILFIIIAVLISVTLNAQKWYVATTGSDTNGDGSVTYPWKTVKHAADTIKSTNGFVGDTIVVGAGTFSEPVQPVLSIGISLIGQQVSPLTSVITSANAIDIINANSASGNAVNGNQSISYIKFDGNNLTALRAITADFRSNVSIHHCDFVDFHWNAIKQNNSNQSYLIQPTNVLAQGTKIYNCTFDNCSDKNDNPWIGGFIIIVGSVNLEVYNNTFNIIDRPNTSAIKGSYYYNTKFHNNIINKPEVEAIEWNFFVEMHYCKGGFELYDNTFNGWGGYDFSGCEQGTYDFGAKIYRNQFIAVNQPSAATYNNPTFAFESFYKHESVYMYQNYFKNTRTAITITNNQVSVDNIWIYYNIIDGFAPYDWAYNYGIYVESKWGSTTPTPISNLHILNNVIKGNTGANAGIMVTPAGNITDLEISNNIIINASRPMWFLLSDETPTIENLSIKNNIYFDNTASNDILWGAGITYVNRILSGDITSDPLFVGTGTPPLNYKLQSGSPAKDAGISVGLTSDYGGYSVPVGPLPDIGAWEYGADVTPPNWHPTGLGWDDIYFKNNFRDTVNFTVPPTIAGAPLDLAALLPSGLTATVNDLNATQGATGNLQGQINTKSNTASPIFTGSITAPGLYLGIDTIKGVQVTKSVLNKGLLRATAAGTIGGLSGGVAGQILKIVNTSATTLVLTHNGAGTQKIMNTAGANVTMDAQYDAVTLIFDGTYWFITGKNF